MTAPNIARPSHALAPAVPRSVVVLAWVAMVGIDFLLHGGLLSPLYDWTSPFLIEPTSAFVRIPIAYAGLGVQAITLGWLLPRVGTREPASGAATAGVIGGAMWAGFLLGLASISTAGPTLLLGWWVAEVAEAGIAGWLIGSGIAGARPRSIALRVAALVIGCVVVTIGLQTVGYAQAPDTR